MCGMRTQRPSGLEHGHGSYWGPRLPIWQVMVVYCLRTFPSIQFCQHATAKLTPDMVAPAGGGAHQRHEASRLAGVQQRSRLNTWLKVRDARRHTAHDRVLCSHRVDG